LIGTHPLRHRSPGISGLLARMKVKSAIHATLPGNSGWWRVDLIPFSRRDAAQFGVGRVIGAPG
jgi:hypothetical protein